MTSQPSNVEKVREYLASVDSHPDLPEAAQDHSNSPNPFDDQFHEFITSSDDTSVDKEDVADGMRHMGLDEETIEKINEVKKNGMLLSAFEDDDEGIEEKNLDCEGEIFLTAAEEGHLDVVRDMLMKNKEILMWCDSDKYTALHRAAYNNHLEVLKFLLENGADPEARTVQGWTALHSASNWSNYVIVGRLLTHGVNVNSRSHGNSTALHVALCSKGDPEDMFHTVRYLVQAPGIDLSAISGAGDTPLELARRNSCRCYELIKDKLNRI